MKGAMGPAALAACLAVALTLAGGCANQRAETAANGPASLASKADMRFRSVYLENFTVAPHGDVERRPKSHLDAMQTSLLDQLRALSLFDEVKGYTGAEPTEGALIVRGEVTTLRIVSEGARFWLGAWLRESEVAVHVKLIDAATGSEFGEYDVEDAANTATGGRVEQFLPSRIAARIVEYIVFKARK